MNLEGFDYTYFALLVKFGNAKNDSEKETALKELEREAHMNKIRIVDADAYRYYEDPTCPIVRELAPIMPRATLGEMASKIRSNLPREYSAFRRHRVGSPSLTISTATRWVTL